MGCQLIALVGVVSYFISYLSHGGVTLDTAMSSAFTLLLGLPLLLLLYYTNEDRVLKNIFLAFFVSNVILTISGIMWYVLAGSLNMPWLVDASKVVMLFSYLPTQFVIFDMLWKERSKVSAYMKIFITFVSLSAISLISYFATTNYVPADGLSIVVYTAAMIIDICSMAMFALLIFIYTPTRVRYILSIGFVYMFLSFLGDSASLIGYLGDKSTFSYAQIFYNIMLLSMIVGLLLYSLFANSRVKTVEEVNKELGDTRHAMDDLILQMPDATCIFDPDGRAIVVNDPFLAIFHCERQDLLGKFNIFEHAESLNCEIKDKIPLLKKGETIALDRAKLTLPGKRQLYLSFKIFPTFAQDGSISSYVSILGDITESVLREEELVHAKALVELYIDLMGHDINNMNQIGMGYLEMALDTIDVPAESKPLLMKPMEAMENSSRLIDNVKKLRYASSGELDLKKMDLGAVLANAIKEHGQAPGREVAIDYKVMENTPVYANELLNDVFVNLLNNAIKHSSGLLRISIKQEAMEKDGKKYYMVTIEDNGPGIPDDMKPVLFDRILRSRKKIGGNGIGLYLVKSLVESYGGIIAVEDRVPGERHQGSRFIVTLPAA